MKQEIFKTAAVIGNSVTPDVIFAIIRERNEHKKDFDDETFIDVVYCVEMPCNSNTPNWKWRHLSECMLHPLLNYREMVLSCKFTSKLIKETIIDAIIEAVDNLSVEICNDTFEKK